MTPDVATAAPGRSRLRRRRTFLVAAIALVLVVALFVVAVSCLPRNTSTPPTVRVDRGPVTLAVNASGNITPAGQQSLGFADGGTVSQVLVKVGDRVAPGQTLARIDDTVARQTLAQKQATLDQQLATLAKLRGGNSVEAAQASLDQARDTESKTRTQVDATNASNRSATARARTQLQFDQSSLDRAEDQLGADRSACRASPRTTTPTPAATAGAPTTALGGSTGTSTTTGTPTRSTTTTARITTASLTTATTLPTVSASIRLAADSAPLGNLDDDLDNADGRSGPACARLLSDRQAVQQAQGAVVSSRTALDAAQQREKTDTAAGQVSLSNARNSVVTPRTSSRPRATTARRTSRPSRPRSTTPVPGSCSRRRTSTRP